MVAVARHKVIAILVAFLCHAGIVLAEGPAWEFDNTAWEYDNTAWGTAKPYWNWTADYRVRSLFNSHTSYQFGLPEWYDPTWAPLSKLDWALDSTWHGFEIGLESVTERIRFEWLMPMSPRIDGSMADYDWLTPSDPSQLDSLTLSSLRWNEGQMIDLSGEVKMINHCFGWPIEIWPMLGFRWQRFNMTAYDINSLIPPDGMVYQGPVITFSQQYYTFYLGGQLQGNVVLANIPIVLKIQGDWGATAAYNSDNHLLRDGGTRYTMERTNGDTVHFAFSAEAMLCRNLSIGAQIDHMSIRTTGSHRWVVYSNGIDERWNHGVEVKSDQTSLTGFVRLRF